MKILLATDGSDHAMKAAEQTAHLARLDPEARVILLCVLPMPITYEEAISAGVGFRHQSYEEQIAQWAGQVLVRTEEALGLPKERVDRRTLIGIPGDVICDLARDEQVDMICMGARGLSLLAQLLLGSTSQRVLHLAPCPVLIAR